jgi:hypothetical protein
VTLDTTPKLWRVTITLPRKPRARSVWHHTWGVLATTKAEAIRKAVEKYRPDMGSSADADVEDDGIVSSVSYKTSA